MENLYMNKHDIGIMKFISWRRKFYSQVPSPSSLYSLSSFSWQFARLVRWHDVFLPLSLFQSQSVWRSIYSIWNRMFSVRVWINSCCLSIHNIINFWLAHLTQALLVIQIYYLYPMTMSNNIFAKRWIKRQPPRRHQHEFHWSGCLKLISFIERNDAINEVVGHVFVYTRKVLSAPKPIRRSRITQNNNKTVVERTGVDADEWRKKTFFIFP